MIVAALVQFGIYKLVDWLYTGPHDDVVFWASTGVFWVLIVACMVWTTPGASKGGDDPK